MKELKNLKRIAQEELERLNDKYEGKSEFTAADAEMYKCLAMALEKHMRIEQIESEMHGEDWGENEGSMSGRRGRAMNGRFVSREGASYADGYSQGYSEAMRQTSGHYPMGPWPEYGGNYRP